MSVAESLGSVPPKVRTSTPLICRAHVCNALRQGLHQHGWIQWLGSSTAAT